MGTYTEEQLTCVEQLLERAEKQRDEAERDRATDIRGMVALNDKVDGLKKRLRECRDAVNAEKNYSLATEALVDMADIQIGRYLRGRGFEGINSLENLNDGDWIANLVGEKEALIFSIPTVKIEGAGSYYVKRIYWSLEDHEHKEDISWYDSYKKVDGDKNNCFRFTLESLLTSVRPGTDPVIFDPCRLEFNEASGIYVYKLDLGCIEVKVSGLNTPYYHCLRHEQTDIQELLIKND